MVDPSLDLPQGEKRVLDLIYVSVRHTLDYRLEQIAVPVREPPHHPHIHPDDFPVADINVARMGIRMEKPVGEHLLKIIIRKLIPYLRQVIAHLFKLILLPVERISSHKLHDYRSGCRVFRKEFGRRHIAHIRVELRKVLEIRRFLKKIHLLKRHAPHLIKDIGKIDRVKP